MPFYYGHLREVSGPIDPGFGQPGGPVDPGYGIGEGARPGHDLPGAGHPWIPGHLPSPPPGVWPPPNATLPIVPAPPDTPPGAIWPPVGNPPIWSGGVTPPVHPGGGPVPPEAGTKPPEPKTYWLVAGIPGVGWRYVAIDPSLQPLPPVAPEPK